MLFCFTLGKIIFLNFTFWFFNFDYHIIFQRNCVWVYVFVHTYYCPCPVIAILSSSSLDMNYSACVVLLDFSTKIHFFVSSMFYPCLVIFDLFLHLKFVLQMFAGYLLDWCWKENWKLSVLGLSHLIKEFPKSLGWRTSWLVKFLGENSFSLWFKGTVKAANGQE